MSGRKTSSRKNVRIIGIYLVLIGLIFAVCFALFDTGTPVTSNKTTTTETAAPTEPHVVSTASIGVTGDILGHGPVLQAAIDQNGNYDFSEMFTYVEKHFKSFDFMVANLEVTLGGPEKGFRGYPTFNCPDSIVDALLDSGVDMMLTANNHTYDTGHDGLLRTQQVLKEKGMKYVGTRQTQDDAFYTVQNINGIKIGMICYTYETEYDGGKALNGIPLSADSASLVNSFDYTNLEAFYTEADTAVKAMEKDGADAVMLYIHWGDEYNLSPNEYQKSIAQKLCDLGVDVIVGGHPHVVQSFDTLTSANGNKTYCIYSVGNCVSNQSRNTLSVMNSTYTEDGMIFSVEFEKWNNGDVKISDVNIIPTWVNKSYAGGNTVYSIVPLDSSLEAWNNLGVSNVNSIYESYKRTMSVVGEGLNECRKSLNQPEAVMAFGENQSISSNATQPS